ncbi:MULTISPECIES: SRPBCC family protein [Corynebacterium]|uniref:SRPBCC family protein n=1 Tax=Corynebacterium TaxID=1716 RepID=UPI001659AB71|nr:MULTISPECIES: SRPBCC family protein [Corynebacterium]QNP92082.1 SRPBCC family protein [Corynebacterium zhongnanshanii]
MSFKSVHTAVQAIDHDPALIERVLHDAENFPEWNPAMSHVEPLDKEGEYAVTVHGVLRGTMTQVPTDARAIKYRIVIPGLVEESTFAIDPQGRGAEVTHTVAQKGILARVIGDQESSRVPHKRLARLAHTLDTVLT